MSYHHQTLWQKNITSHKSKHVISRNKYFEYTKTTWRGLGSALLKMSVCQEIWVAMGCGLTFLCWGRSADKENCKVPTLCLLIGTRTQEPWTHMSWVISCLWPEQAVWPWVTDPFSSHTVVCVARIICLSARCTHMNTRDRCPYHDVFKQYEVKKALGKLKARQLQPTRPKKVSS